MNLDRYILEAVSRRRNSFDLSPDSKIEDFRSALDKSGFYEKSDLGTGARAVFLYNDSKRKNRRMYFIDWDKPAIWASFPEDDTVYYFNFMDKLNLRNGRIMNVSIYIPQSSNGKSIDYISETNSFTDRKDIETALKELNYIL